MTALVGPLKRVWFNASSRYYDLPRNTLDLRYEACASHHPACACREASISEAWGEMRAEIDAMETAILAAIKGHQTYAYTSDGWPDEFAQCKCQACAIARAARVGRIQCSKDRRESAERLEAERREREAARIRAFSPRLDEVSF